MSKPCNRERDQNCKQSELTIAFERCLAFGQEHHFHAVHMLDQVAYGLHGLNPLIEGDGGQDGGKPLTIE